MVFSPVGISQGIKTVPSNVLLAVVNTLGRKLCILEQATQANVPPFQQGAGKQLRLRGYFKSISL